MLNRTELMIQRRWLRIIPVALIMYTISYVDRTNISLALDREISSMMQELHMNDRMAGDLAGIFFLGYLVLQIPGGYLAARWSARLRPLGRTSANASSKSLASNGYPILSYYGRPDRTGTSLRPSPSQLRSPHVLSSPGPGHFAIERPPSALSPVRPRLYNPRAVAAALGGLPYLLGSMLPA